MAVDSPNLRVGFLQAASDISASQFCGVKVGASDLTVDLESTGGLAIVGILQNKPTANQAADVAFVGVVKAKAGAAYSRGVLLMTDTAGRLILATSGNFAVATALEASAAANEIHTVLLFPLAYKLP